MNPSKPVKAYLPDAASQLVPLDAESLVLEFPSGDTLEVSWEAPHPDDPRPVCAQVWGGRRVTVNDNKNANRKSTAVVLLLSAANLVLIHPDSYP